MLLILSNVSVLFSLEVDRKLFVLKYINYFKVQKVAIFWVKLVICFISIRWCIKAQETWMWEYEQLTNLLKGETVLSSNCSMLLLLNYALVSLTVPLVLLTLYYINDLLVVWDELTVHYTVPSLVAEGILFVNLLVSFVLLSTYNNKHIPRFII